MRGPNARAAVLVAATATLMIAQQIAGKAARDALFLGAFGIAALPTMFLATAAAAVAVAPLGSRLLSKLTPARAVPLAFGVSATLMVAQAVAAGLAPRVCAVTLYLHNALVNALIASWFWSLVGERFDPRTARREMHVMLGGATLGGLLGGLIAERVAATAGVTALLAALAAIHAVCALAARRVARDVPRAPGAEPAVAAAAASPGVPRSSSYVRDLAALVCLGATVATLVDYYFKSEVLAAYPQGATLVRFFAVFYGVTSAVSFLVQVAVTPVLLSRLGPARTLATLPAALIAGSAGALAVPGLASAVVLRGAEASIAPSAYRSGYELLFNPLPPAEKRRIKPVIDVGFDRLGDALGGGVLAILVAVVGHAPRVVLLPAVVVLSLATMWLDRRLLRGYAGSLERSLRERGAHLDVSTTRTTSLASVTVPATDAAGSAPGPVGADAPAREVDPILGRIAALRSGDDAAVRAALHEAPLDAALVPHAVSLLAWDAVASDALSALRKIAASCTGQLVDAMLSPDESFAVRRRLPRVLSELDSPRALDGLIRGLQDARFEVRYRCGRALARIHRRSPAAAIDRQRVLDAVRREVSVDRGVWESQRLLDRSEDVDGERGLADDFLRERSSRSLEHVFTLLSLALPSKPVEVAFRGLHCDDEMLRGTALEYLEGALPADVRSSLWPFLEDHRPDERVSRPPDAVLRDLLASNESIQMRLDELRAARPDAPR